jgi:hypothetical protein
VLLLEAGTLKGAQIFSLGTRIKIGVLGREESAQTLDLKEAFYFFLSGQQPKRGGAGLFIAPTSKRAGVKPLEAGLRPDLFGPPD